ncbi:MAG: hypothetical protein EBQ96_08810 [Proteobacteria bacterium]|nr:hypothetical protein [Pseudomonadota bacterium]
MSLDYTSLLATSVSGYNKAGYAAGRAVLSGYFAFVCMSPDWKWATLSFLCIFFTAYSTTKAVISFGEGNLHGQLAAGSMPKNIPQ